MAVWSPPVDPSPGTAITVEPRIARAEFGDGYSTRAPRGVNVNQRRASVVWEGLSHANAATIVAHFDSLEGASFDWAVPPDSVQRRWILGRWSRPEPAALASRIQVELEEVADVN